MGVLGALAHAMKGQHGVRTGPAERADELLEHALVGGLVEVAFVVEIEALEPESVAQLEEVPDELARALGRGLEELLLDAAPTDHENRRHAVGDGVLCDLSGKRGCGVLRDRHRAVDLAVAARDHRSDRDVRQRRPGDLLDRHQIRLVPDPIAEHPWPRLAGTGGGHRTAPGGNEETEDHQASDDDVAVHETSDWSIGLADRYREPCARSSA